MTTTGVHVCVCVCVCVCLCAQANKRIRELHGMKMLMQLGGELGV